MRLHQAKQIPRPGPEELNTETDFWPQMPHSEKPCRFLRTRNSVPLEVRLGGVFGLIYINADLEVESFAGKWKRSAKSWKRLTATQCCRALQHIGPCDVKGRLRGPARVERPGHRWGLRG